MCPAQPPYLRGAGAGRKAPRQRRLCSRVMVYASGSVEGPSCIRRTLEAEQQVRVICACTPARFSAFGPTMSAAISHVSRGAGAILCIFRIFVNHVHMYLLLNGVNMQGL